MQSQGTSRLGQFKTREELGSSWAVAGELPEWVFAADQSERNVPKIPRPSASFLTVKEVGAQLRVSDRTIRRLIARGQLEAVRLGRSVRISPSSLERMLNRNEVSISNYLEGYRD